MRRTLLTFTAVLLVALSLQALAQYEQQGQGQPSGQEQGEHHRMGKHGGRANPDQELAHMTKELNLTSDQQSKIKPILDNQAQQMQQLHQDTSLTQQDRMSKMRDIHHNTMSQIREVLSPDQQQKLDAMKENRAEHHGKRGQAQPQ